MTHPTSNLKTDVPEYQRLMVEVGQMSKPQTTAVFDYVDVLRADIEQLQMRLKHHEPVSLYNGRDIDSWKSEAERLRAALSGLLTRYVDLVNCGDCGNWDPEKEREVIEARAALSGDEPVHETSPNELTEAEKLLQAWADPLPPNGRLYWAHVEKAREYFRRRGSPPETTIESRLAAFDELVAMPDDPCTCHVIWPCPVHDCAQNGKGDV